MGSALQAGLRSAGCIDHCVVAMQAQALESAVKRFSKLEDAAHEAQLATDIHAVRNHSNVWRLVLL